ncbi:9750_t:CDS:1, partial [Gigaspora rosea]
YTPKHNQEVTQRNSRTLLDNSHNVKNYSDVANDTDSNSIDDNDRSYSEENKENIDLSLIQNPIIQAKKGAPRKSRFKGSQETNLKNKERPKAAGRKPTECQQCHKFRHNKVGCEKWYKKIKFYILLSDQVQ